MNTPTTRRRPLPSKMTHLQAQAAMPGTLNGDSAARELAQLTQPGATPTAPTPESATEATPTAPTASVLVAEDASVAPIAAPAPPASEPANEVEVNVPSNPVPRSRSKATAKAEKQPESSAIPGSVTRLSTAHTREVKGALHHFLVEHETRLTLQDFVGDALDFYLAHLRKTNKLPSKK